MFFEVANLYGPCGSSSSSLGLYHGQQREAEVSAPPCATELALWPIELRGSGHVPGDPRSS